MENGHIVSAKINNLGRIKKFECDSFSNINLIIGENGSGKTFLLKALYSAIKSLEDYKRGDDIRNISEILSEKLRWTYQAEKLGDIVTKNAEAPYSFFFSVGNDTFEYQFSKDAITKVVNLSEPIKRNDCNSIFIPAKEVLSLYSIILKSREVDRSFGFDDTYYDLAKALRVSPTRGRNYTAFAESRIKLQNIVNGKVDLDENTNRWYYKEGNYKYAIGTTSEGIKKIALLDRLLANGYLGRKSVIFIDELESALHPTAISDFIDMLYYISSEMDIQIFIASHSYFVIKKLCLVAMENKKSIKCISMNSNDININDLADGMPNNSIIDESIRLYEEEVEQVL